MMLGTTPLGTPGTVASTGSAAGTSSAAAAGASFTATVRTGRVVVVGHTVEVHASAPAALTPPPAAAERLLRWVLPLELQEPVLGDLAEIYANAYAKFGEREARRLYWWHTIRSIAPVLRRGAVKWSVVAAVAELLRRILGN